MSLKIKCHLKWNVTLNEISLQLEFHSNWNDNQIGMTIKLECHSNWNVTQIGMLLKYRMYTKAALNGQKRYKVLAKATVGCHTFWCSPKTNNPFFILQ